MTTFVAVCVGEFMDHTWPGANIGIGAARVAAQPDTAAVKSMAHSKDENLETPSISRVTCFACCLERSREPSIARS